MGPWVVSEGDLNTENGAISPDREIMPPEYGSDRRRCQPCSRGTVMDLPPGLSRVHGGPQAGRLISPHAAGPARRGSGSGRFPR
jgi:hypothetical protein